MADKTLRVTAAQIEESVERLHNHSNFSVLDSITSSRINEWDNKSNGEHTHTADEIEGLDNLNIDMSNYYTKAEVTNKIAEASLSGGNVDLSSYALKEEVTNLVNQISSLEANISNLTSTNTTLTNRITTLETKVTELDLQLNPPIAEKMYYGRLSATEVGIPPIKQYSEITEQMILNGENITVSDPKTLNKESMGTYNQTAEGDYVVVAVPKSRNYEVTQDNGFGGKAPFNEETAGANGIDITIDRVEYKLYGQILLSQGEIFVYVD